MITFFCRWQISWKFLGKFHEQGNEYCGYGLDFAKFVKVCVFVFKVSTESEITCHLPTIISLSNVVAEVLQNPPDNIVDIVKYFL